MNTALNTALNTTHITAPIKALWQWLVATPGQTQRTPTCIGAPVKHVTARARALRKLVARVQPHTSKVGISQPLRVLRVLEVGQTPAQVGRMRISGRMADVCAELDRLAAQEALLH